VQGARKVQDRRVLRHTREFELFEATPQSGVFQQPEGRGFAAPLFIGVTGGNAGIEKNF
jgi:hypothetical protein